SPSGEVQVSPTVTIQDGVVTVERPEAPSRRARDHRLDSPHLPPWERERDGDAPPEMSAGGRRPRVYAGARRVPEDRRARAELYRPGGSIEPSPEEEQAAAAWYEEQRRQGRL